MLENNHPQEYGPLPFLRLSTPRPTNQRDGQSGHGLAREQHHLAIRAEQRAQLVSAEQQQPSAHNHDDGAHQHRHLRVQPCLTRPACTCVHVEDTAVAQRQM